MKRNKKYVKTRETRINHLGERVNIYKKVSANRTTWTPTRSHALVFKRRRERFGT